ncbi:MAG TPA: pilus assembly protein TadG-related protein [Candidatus Dormibacteraeota bacterium]|nr:pilus assembly protein TadG-related protein [Candidatus Dormibacteraeota bacterium]
MPIFAITAVAMMLVIALAIDYGFLTQQHRNLQTFADHAAVAGAQQLTKDGSSGFNGRRGAMTYLRDNLGATSSTMSLSSGVPCQGGTQPFSANIDNCQLPAPYQDTTVTIHSPGDYTNNYAYDTPSVSVKIVDSSADSPATLMGLTAPVGAYAEAKAQLGGLRYSTALYSDGCVNIQSPPLLSGPSRMNGDLYLNQCTVNTGGLLGGLLGGGLCVGATPDSSGNVIVGPEATTPPVGGSLLGLTGCGGLLSNIANILSETYAEGSVAQISSSMQPPALPPPPNVPTVAGTANNPCTNGKGGSNCYNPGVYTNSPLIVNNNLNPGIYVVDISSGGCYTDTSVTSCGGVVFTGNTMNANINAVAHQCWSAITGNAPLTDTFTAPCPDGLMTNPAGFPNIPSVLGGQNYGVTFILTGKAGFCMGSDSADWHCQPAGSGTTINVLLSPYCASGFTPTPASATCTNAAAEDGAYAVYGSSQGAIHASGVGSLNMTGTVYLPKGSLVTDANPGILGLLGSMAKFNLTGQMVVHDVNVNTAGAASELPFVYYNGSIGAVLPTVVTLVQ